MGTEEKKGYKILLGTTLQWTASAITPNAGQICIDTDTGIVKVGDGKNKYSNLPHLINNTEITHLLNSFQFEYAEDESKISLTPIGGETVYEITLTDLDKIKQIYQTVNLTGQTIAYINAPVEIPDPATEDHISLSVGGNAIFQGNVTIQGDTTVVDAENLKVKDKLITVAKDNAAALTSPAGLHVPDYDGEGHDGALVFDSTGTAYVGDVVINNGNINTQQSQLQPLATRSTTNDDGLVNGNLIQWNSAKTTLVDSGKTVKDFVPKTTTAWRVYATNGASNQVLLNYTAEPSTNALMQRDSNGRAKINTPVDRGEIANKGYVDDGFVKKVTTTDYTRAYATQVDGKQTTVIIDTAPTAWALAERDGSGHVKVADPEGQNDAVNKKYAEDNFVAKVTTPAIVYATTAEDGSPRPIPWNTAAVPNTVVMRDVNGRTKVADPEGQNDAVNKAYVDNKDIGTISGAIENGKLKISLTSVDGQKVIQSEGIEIVTSEGGTVDDIVSGTSVKPVQNKVIKAYVDSFQTITILGAND